jgi:ketosteroid isomerase-like protein
VKIKTRIFLVSALLLPLTASAEDWTEEQKEVLAFEEACVTTKDIDEFAGCFHDDFVGWGQGYPVPTSKDDRSKTNADSFESFDSETLLFNPISVIVKGDMAIVSYLQTSKITNKATEEVEYSTQAWTDVCLKERGKWTWIADHGTDLTDDQFN